VERDAMRRMHGDSRNLNCSLEYSSCRRPTPCLAFFVVGVLLTAVITHRLSFFRLDTVNTKKMFDFDDIHKSAAHTFVHFLAGFVLFCLHHGADYVAR
jgi:hypothetical protein